MPLMEASTVNGIFPERSTPHFSIPLSADYAMKIPRRAETY